MTQPTEAEVEAMHASWEVNAARWKVRLLGSQHWCVWEDPNSDGVVYKFNTEGEAQFFKRDKLIRAALTAAAQVRERAGQENMIIGTLGTIANMSDEENEWDGTDKFHEAREMARTVMAHLPADKPDLMPIYGATEAPTEPDSGPSVLGNEE